MMDTANLAVFLGASFLLIIAPGPDIVFLITQGLNAGRKAGLITALGLSAGNLVHTLGAALGISVIFQTSAFAFQALKFAGVGYLWYLAWKTLAAPRMHSDSRQSAALSRESLFLRGLLMNVLNPKVALFFLAFLPQFADPAAGRVGVQMLALGILFTLLVVVVFGSIGLFAGSFKRKNCSQASAATNRYWAWLVAGIYLALGARLAWLGG